MKKAGAILILLLIILAFPIVASQDPTSPTTPPTAAPSTTTNTPTTPTTTTPSSTTTPPTTTIPAALRERLEKPTPKIDEKLESEINIPENWQIPARIVFGIKSDTEISLSKLIILISIWIILFLFTIEVIRTMHMFKETIVWLMAFTLTIIFGVTGTVKSLSDFFFGFTSFFKFLEEWELGKVSSFFIIIIIISILIKRFIIQPIENKAKKSQAQQEGMEVGTELGFLSSLRKWFSWSKKNRDS